MLRRTILLAFASAAALAVAVSAGGAPTEDQLIETVTVHPKQQGLVTETNFLPSESYKLVFSGTMHTQCPSGPPSYGLVMDEDVFYSYYRKFEYDSSADTTPNPRGSWFSYTPEQHPAFSSGHTYTIELPANPARGQAHLTFGDAFGAFPSQKDCTRTGQWTVKVYRVESGTTKTVNEPAPGKSKDIESPPLPAGGVDCGGSPGRALAKAQVCKVGVRGTGGDLKGTEIASEGTVEVDGDPHTAAQFLFWCWISNEFKDEDGMVVDGSPTERLQLCIYMLVLMIKNGDFKVSKPAIATRTAEQLPRSSVAAGCRTQAIALGVRKRGGKYTVVGQLKKAKLKPSSVRYSCSASGGEAALKLTAPGGARNALGKKLRLEVYRAKKAPRRSGKLSITFGWK